MQVVVDSLLLHYTRTGKGKTVLILHGWGDNSSSFRGLIASLAHNYDVIALDLPGFGGSARPAEAWSLDDYVACVGAFLRKIDTTKLWAIVGHSNGGAMAIRGLASGVFVADRLVLLASAGIRGVHGRRNSALRIITKTGKFFSTPLPAPLKRRLRGKLYTAVGSDMLFAEEMQETFKRIVADDVRADAAKLTLDTLLLYGEKDTATPVWYGQQFHELIPGSTLEVMPTAGHFIHVDEANRVETAVKEFLR